MAARSRTSWAEVFASRQPVGERVGLAILRPGNVVNREVRNLLFELHDFEKDRYQMGSFDLVGALQLPDEQLTVAVDRERLETLPTGERQSGYQRSILGDVVGGPAQKPADLLGRIAVAKNESETGFPGVAPRSPVHPGARRVRGWMGNHPYSESSAI